jgi:BON domain
MKAKKSLFTVALLTLALAVGVGCTKPAKSDAQLSGDVQNKISSEGALQGRQVAVQANAGTVTLTGTVNSDAEKIAASNAASRVEGVHQVLNNLTVAPQQAAVTTPQPELQAAAAEPEPTPTRRPSAARTSSHSSGSRSAHHSDSDSSSQASNNGSSSQTAMSAAPSAPAITTPAPPAPPRKVSVPDGTSLSVRLTDGLDSERNQAGDTFRATLNSPISLEDNIVVPDGADIEGRVVEVKSAGHFQGASLLSLELTKISFNGHSYPIHTNTWLKQGTGRGKNTAAKVGGGAALGAIIGGIAGGGKGAAIGSVVGAGAGTGAQVVTHGQQIKLNSEQLLSFTLASPVTVLPASTNRNGGTRLPVPQNDSSDQ